MHATTLIPPTTPTGIAARTATTCDNCGATESSEWVSILWESLGERETFCEPCARTQTRHMHTKPTRR